jgi:hypothetical protein
MLLLIPCDNPISILAIIHVKAAYLEGEKRPFADDDLRGHSGCGESRGQRIAGPETAFSRINRHSSLIRPEKRSEWQDPLQSAIARNKR